jgi:hypothetical protein
LLARRHGAFERAADLRWVEAQHRSGGSKRSSIVKIRPTLLAAAVAALGTMAACTPRQPTDAAAAKPIRGQEYGRLEMMNVTSTSHIDSLTLRGIFKNPYDETVDGIRVVLRITEQRSPTSAVIVRAQDLMDTSLEPGATVPFAITAKVDPTTLINVGMYLEGFAVRRGDELLPVSPAWEEK